VLNTRQKWVAMLGLGALCAGCCEKDETPTPGASEVSSSQRRVILPEDPEPTGTGFKTLRASCTEPVVRLELASPAARPDASSAVDVVRDFVTSNREFASPMVSYAELTQAGTPLVLARCPDPDTANRLARKIGIRHRALRAVPVCGFATSGWAGAHRALQLP